MIVSTKQSAYPSTTLGMRSQMRDAQRSDLSPKSLPILISECEKAQNKPVWRGGAKEKCKSTQNEPISNDKPEPAKAMSGMGNGRSEQNSFMGGLPPKRTHFRRSSS